MNLTVSLIVTTYNWPEALSLTLASVTRQTRMPAEVLIADDGSGPQTREVVAYWSERLSCPIKYLWQADEGYRLARSRNIAVAAAQGSYIVLVDGDMVLHPRFIEDHAACAREDCFIQGARPRFSAQRTMQMLRAGSTAFNVFTPGLEHRAYALRSALLSRCTSRAKASLTAVQGCNQSFWREHIVAVNGFDERFTAWGPEDREFCARLLHIGVRRHYVRHRAIACHLFHTTRAPAGYNPFDRLLADTLLTRAVWCTHGLDRHLQRAADQSAEVTAVDAGG